MADHSGRGVSRRDVLTTGAGVAGATLLAGCSEGFGGTGGGDGGDGGDTYTVSMAPTGEVSFDRPPESVAHYFPGYADMAVAVGHADSVNSVGVVSRYHVDHYDELDGVSIDKSSLTELVGESGIDKELLYDLDSDLHMIDPEWLVNNGFFGFEQADIEELSENVAPFLGNSIFRRTDKWHDYRFYTLYEAFGKVAKAHQEEERYESFRAFHDDFLAALQASLPSADARPNGLLCFAGSDEPEAFSPYRLTDKGTNKKPFRDLGIPDALAGTGIEGLSTTERGQIDYEAMLQVDPDALFVRGHEDKSRGEFEDTVVAFMEQHDTASELTAVQENRVLRGGPIYLGPIQHLFVTERLALELFPDTYSGELFDRDELAGIITGDK
ncbi:ABC transporter substrate-binding protein [Haloglomus litoreum]|uniref:ABC transporter substrate-binding protein n=1 Tax=Haloglomus litoreum TaxID=3034026 RepID=UPI0023E8F8B7|nr:ABC transporter substrate-binding protein [Haloglomus sp. DT116]